MAVQTIASFFLAGIYKLSQPVWRSGNAVRTFLAQSVFRNPTIPLPRATAYGILAFELSFPLALALPMVYLPLAIMFHFANSYFFGLNRFLFAWASAYPALYFLSQRWN